MIRAFWLLLLSLTFIGLPSSGGTETPFKILVIGDSISAGVVGYPTGRPYTEILLEWLHAEVETAIHLDNVACSGTTSKDWTISQGKPNCYWLATPPTLYENQARPHLPADLVILMLGGNDATTWGGTAPFTAEEYRAYMLEVIGNLKRDGVRKIIWMVSPKFGRDNCTYYGMSNAVPNQALAEYREVALDVCSQDSLVECGPDLYSTFPASYFGAFCDPHPNKFGSAFIAQQLQKPVERVYRELNPIEVEISIFPWRGAKRIVIPRNSRAQARGLRRRALISILSTEEFNAPEAVIPGSITFGVIGDEYSLIYFRSRRHVGPACWKQDTNRDGFRDLLCAFHAGRLGLSNPGLYNLILKANTTSDWPIRGELELRVVKKEFVVNRTIVAEFSTGSKGVPTIGP